MTRFDDWSLKTIKVLKKSKTWAKPRVKESSGTTVKRGDWK